MKFKDRVLVAGAVALAVAFIAVVIFKPAGPNFHDKLDADNDLARLGQQFYLDSGRTPNARAGWFWAGGRVVEDLQKDIGTPDEQAEAYRQLSEIDVTFNCAGIWQLERMGERDLCKGIKDFLHPNLDQTGQEVAARNCALSASMSLPTGATIDGAIEEPAVCN